jgi:site-specific recombinase XerD
MKMRFTVNFSSFYRQLYFASRQAIIILRTLYEWLMRQCYLVGNPWVGVTPRQALPSKVQIGRSFTLKQWRYLKEYLAVLPETGANRRLRLVMDFAYATGLRLSEIINARVRDLEKIEFDEGEIGWMLTVIGKGGKPREVPVPIEVIEDISVYLRQRGLHPDPEMHHDKATFLIGKVDDGGPTEQAYPAEEGITAGTLYEQLKRFFQKAAKGLAKSDAKSAARLASASTHWLRHSHGSHAVAAGTPIEIVQNNLGHASLSTTTIYVTSEKKRRYQEMQKFWNGKR